MEKYYRHFKGNLYRLIGIAKDSETLEELVVYQALYGDHQMWVRPAEMFFGKVERDGKVMPRFEEISKEEAEKTRPWTYILGVLDCNGNRVERYSWYETNSWKCYGQTDEKTLQNQIESCRRFRSESTSRWHVYKRMRGSSELELVY